MFVAVQTVQLIKHGLHVPILFRQRLAVTDVFFRSGMHRLAVQRSLSVRLGDVLGYLGVIVLPWALLECLKAAE
jgi:hypothetical protein